jgi:hypothetical protein
MGGSGVPGECRAQAAAGEHGHGDEGFGCVESVGAFGQCSLVYGMLMRIEAKQQHENDSPSAPVIWSMSVGH